MPPLPDRFWQWVTSALLAALLAILTISWQSSRHEHDALGQMYDWTNKAQDGRLTVIETKQEDVRARLSKLEAQYVYETQAALADLRKRLERLEFRPLRSEPAGPP
jgi:hypothetical protein